MRKRIIKPQFWASERLATVSLGARLAFIGLWQIADRDGHVRNIPRHIGAQLFPYEDVPMVAWLAELEKINVVESWYSVEHGHSVLKISAFTKHQSIHMREAESAYSDEYEALSV